MAKDDFFEGETKKGGGAAKPGKKTAKAAPQPVAAPVSGLNLYLAIALILAAFVAGFVVRPVVLPAGDSSVPSASESTPTQAPPLTEEQIQQGQMPEGHPGVTPSETATPSETETPPSGTPSP